MNVPPYPSPTFPRVLVLAAIVAAFYRLRHANIHKDYQDACHDIGAFVCMALVLATLWLGGWFFGSLPEWMYWLIEGRKRKANKNDST